STASARSMRPTGQPRSLMARTRNSPGRLPRQASSSNCADSMYMSGEYGRKALPVEHKVGFDLADQRIHGGYSGPWRHPGPTPAPGQAMRAGADPGPAADGGTSREARSARPNEPMRVVKLLVAVTP